MRIALITPGFSASEDDWCIPVLLDHARLLAREHDVHVFALRYPHRRERYAVHGATVHPLGGALDAGFARLPLLARAYRVIRGEARRQPFDAYHACWADEPGLLAVLAARAAGKPAIVSVMGGELVGLPEIGYGGLLSRANRLLARVSLRSADRVTVGSGYLRDLAAAYAPADRLAIHPWGVDTALFSPGPANQPPWPAEVVNLLQVASLAPIKDHQTCLRAFKLIAEAEPRARLRLVGDGPLLERLRAAGAELGLGDRVSFHGAVAHQAMPDRYRAADLCLLTSRHEAQALVTLEAAACGRATVGTAVGILPDLGLDGLVAPVGDAEALARAALGLIRDPARLAALGAAAADRVRMRHSLERSVRSLIELYAAAQGR